MGQSLVTLKAESEKPKPKPSFRGYVTLAMGGNIRCFKAPTRARIVGALLR
jgi:hypothetical protein